jgi:hypothetical protein
MKATLAAKTGQTFAASPALKKATPGKITIA